MGTLINDEDVHVGKRIELGDFSFRIDFISYRGNEVILSNHNYIMYCTKEN
jgi:hypothetical protein